MWDYWKYKNLNILRREYNSSTKYNDPEVNKDAELLDNLQNIFKDNEASLMLKPHLSKVKSAFYEDCVKKNNHQN